jgi:hypothetical protein
VNGSKYGVLSDRGPTLPMGWSCVFVGGSDSTSGSREVGGGGMNVGGSGEELKFLPLAVVEDDRTEETEAKSYWSSINCIVVVWVVPAVEVVVLVAAEAAVAAAVVVAGGGGTAAGFLLVGFTPRFSSRYCCR